MSKTFSTRPWFYWVILLFLVGETLIVSFRILPFFTAVVVGHQPEAVQWTIASAFVKVAILANLGSIFAAIATITALVMRRRIVFRLYLVVVFFAVILMVYKMSLIGAEMDGRVIAQTIGSLIGSSIQIGLTMWGISILSRSTALTE